MFQYREFLLSVQLCQGVLVQTLLCCLLPAPPHRAELESEATFVVGCQFNFQLYHRVFDVGFGDHCVAVVASSLVVLGTWLVVSIPTHTASRERACAIYDSGHFEHDIKTTAPLAEIERKKNMQHSTNDPRYPKSEAMKTLIFDEPVGLSKDYQLYFKQPAAAL